MLILTLLGLSMVNALFCLVSYKLKNFDIMQIIGSFLLLVDCKMKLNT